MTYPLNGNLPVVPAADLISLTSKANKRGDARVSTEFNGNALGKRQGTQVLRDAGGAIGTRYSLCIAMGPLPADPWINVGGTAAYTPA